MARNASTVRVDLSKYRRFLTSVSAQLRGGGGPLGTVVRQQNARIYLADLLRRFDAQGNGQWRPHAPATVARTGPHRLLNQTGQLRRALTPGGPGNLMAPITNGVRVGIVGGSRSGGGPSQGALAALHQRGTSKMPARPIIVPPSPAARAAMGRNLGPAIQATGRRA